jgi:hypothetical protein
MTAYKGSLKELHSQTYTRFTLEKPPKGKNPTKFLNIDSPTKNNISLQERTKNVEYPPLTLDYRRVVHGLTKRYPRDEPRNSTTSRPSCSSISL